jgi:hypothetical protein
MELLEQQKDLSGEEKNLMEEWNHLAIQIEQAEK